MPLQTVVPRSVARAHVSPSRDESEAFVTSDTGARSTSPEVAPSRKDFVALSEEHERRDFLRNPDENSSHFAELNELSTLLRHASRDDTAITRNRLHEAFVDADIRVSPAHQADAFDGLIRRHGRNPKLSLLLVELLPKLDDEHINERYKCLARTTRTETVKLALLKVLAPTLPASASTTQRESELDARVALFLGDQSHSSFEMPLVEALPVAELSRQTFEDVFMKTRDVSALIKLIRRGVYESKMPVKNLFSKAIERIDRDFSGEDRRALMTAAIDNCLPALNNFNSRILAFKHFIALEPSAWAGSLVIKHLAQIKRYDMRDIVAFGERQELSNLINALSIHCEIPDFMNSLIRCAHRIEQDTGKDFRNAKRDGPFIGSLFHKTMNPASRMEMLEYFACVGTGEPRSKVLLELATQTDNPDILRRILADVAKYAPESLESDAYAAVFHTVLAKSTEDLACDLIRHCRALTNVDPIEVLLDVHKRFAGSAPTSEGRFAEYVAVLPEPLEPASFKKIRSLVGRDEPTIRELCRRLAGTKFTEEQRWRERYALLLKSESSDSLRAILNTFEPKALLGLSSTPTSTTSPFPDFDRTFLGAAIGKLANQSDVRDDIKLAQRMLDLIGHNDPETASRQYLALAAAMPGKAVQKHILNQRSTCAWTIDGLQLLLTRQASLIEDAGSVDKMLRWLPEFLAEQTQATPAERLEMAANIWLAWHARHAAFATTHNGDEFVRLRADLSESAHSATPAVRLMNETVVAYPPIAPPPRLGEGVFARAVSYMAGWTDTADSMRSKTNQ